MKFSLNIDHIATLRNARGEKSPDPVAFALQAEQYGIDGIVVHLREDRRHINDNDVNLLRELITTKLDLEMAAVQSIINIALEVKPELATLVPEKRQELTTEGGLNIIDNSEQIKNAIDQLHSGNIPVSLFIEPEIEHIELAAEINADIIEIHTGVYANAKNDAERFDELEKIRLATKFARKNGLGINAGHGLNYTNIKDFVAISDIDELSIGHAIIARSVFVGLESAIKEMRYLLNNATVIK